MGRYLPGYKDGGPVRSIKNLVDRLGTEYEFHIITVDRDHGDTVAYPGILYEAWNQVGNAKVWYVQPGGFTKEVVAKLAADANLVYVCGCFNDYARSVMALKKKGIIKVPVVIASMGLFSPKSFGIKRPKKKAYMTVLKCLGWFRNVCWSATTEREANDIRREVGQNATIFIAQDLPRTVGEVIREESTTEQLRVVFLSRISRSKNLGYAIEVLSVWGKKNPQRKLAMDIYGNKEDAAYWQECEEQIRQLPDNVTCRYLGEAAAEQVVETFAKYDLFLFPTVGENFGHVIYEALAGGCIPIISNQTPWTMKELNGIGEILDLDARGDWVKSLEKYEQMSKTERGQIAEKCMAFAQNYHFEEAENGYRTVLNL
ncbi:MAG: glycosyltransferase [Lachnospiraceae bacterium]|nr:glycosyltransferase [Lachnospiraceae bacterium]